jgi:hypothetical protein
MTDNQACALTSTALLALKDALDAADSPEDFLAAADAIVGLPENQLALPFDTGSPDTLEPGAPGDDGRDADNAPQVHGFLGELDRANASDQRLWTYLAFVTYRDYMEKRWPLVGIRVWKTRVETRWLLLSPSRGKLVRHGISRLWWISSLTYDPGWTRGDPYAYTREVFRNEDRINSLFDREAGAVPGLVRAVLDHAAQGGRQATDKHLRALMVEITLIYGYRDIGSLDSADMQALVAQSAPATAEVGN